MTNAEIWRLVETCVDDEDTLNRIVVLEGDEYADAVIGMTHDKRLVYSYDKMVEALNSVFEEEGELAEENSEEHILYNVVPTIANLDAHGKLAPVIIKEF